MRASWLGAFRRLSGRRACGEDERPAMRRIDALYRSVPSTARPVAFTLKMNRQRAQRRMRLMGIEALGPKPRTSKPTPEHRIYPYLLRDLTVERPNRVWACDISVPILGVRPEARGFFLSRGVMDWSSRAVLSWRPVEHDGHVLLPGGARGSPGAVRHSFDKLSRRSSTPTRACVQLRRWRRRRAERRRGKSSRACRNAWRWRGNV